MCLIAVIYSYLGKKKNVSEKFRISKLFFFILKFVYIDIFFQSVIRFASSATVA